MRPALVLLLTGTLALWYGQPSRAGGTGRTPTIDDLLKLRTLGSVAIAPGGRFVAYTVTSSDFEEDAFVTHLWLADTASGETFQLTRGARSVSMPRWSPDGRWLAFVSERTGDKSQVFAIRPNGGEALRLTAADAGVNEFAWSPDGTQIAFTAAEPESDRRKRRKEHLGDFVVVRRDYTVSEIWTAPLAEALEQPAAGTRRTTGGTRHARDLAWSPDGTRIVFSGTASPEPAQGGTADLFVLDLSGNAVSQLTRAPGPDVNPRWSPDGAAIVFQSVMGQRDYYYRNSRLAIVPASGGTPRSITDAFDEWPLLHDWTREGIYFSGFQKTARHLFRVDPQSSRITRVSAPDALYAGSFSVAADGRHLAFTAASPTSAPELFVSPSEGFVGRQLTNETRQLAALSVGTRELISWSSRDGTPIEGVLVKPADFDPGRRYPLLVQIHGGPTGIDRPVPMDTRYYPTDIWVARGALVLKVNYRGSAGYGEAFRRLNVRNLGVGDVWDVVSGIEHLAGRGWVDETRVGCMGWSQGGYISAFLTTSTDACRAVSVGAGISNWATYYYNTDIPPFTLMYLGDNPAKDPEIYRKTSPMSYITRARTPTLIQHGEDDRRVPIANGYELRQGLEDAGVPVEMIVYKGFGHGITKPKAMRAVMQHNLEWFNHHLWGDAAPDFTDPDVPEGDEKTKGTQP
jgi:dipeptidyl aminopeptidase/acylaminoacyl peptidase